MISRFITRATKNAKLARFFAGDVAKAEGTSATDSGITQYIDGQLQKRTSLVLKQTEDIEGYVLNLVRDYFRTTNKQNLALESAFTEHGLDSLDSIELAMRVEEDLGYVISAETLPVLNSPKHFVNYIQQVEAFKEENNASPLA